MSRKSMLRDRAIFEGYLARLRQPFNGYKGPPDWKPKEASTMKPVYLRKSKLPTMTDEDRGHYNRVLRMLRATLNCLDDKTSSPRERVNRISYLLAAVELVRPDIQATWREDFVKLLALYREIASRHWEQIVKAESK